jgi:hypothetical protein
MSQEEIERNFAFIVNQQAKFFADIEELKTLAARTDARLTRAIRLAIVEARQEREKRRQLEETFTAKLNALINAQIRTEESVSTFQSQMEGSFAAFQSRMEESSAAFQSQVGQALAEAEVRRVQSEEQLKQALAQVAAEAETRRGQGEEQLRQALAQMAQAIAATNQRIDNELSKP